MVKAASHQLRKGHWAQAEKAGKALAKWLNAPPSSHKSKWLMDDRAGHALVLELVVDARAVLERLKHYKSADQFHEARRKKQLPLQFWKSYRRLNERLGAFTIAPRIDFDGFYGGTPVSWVITDDSPHAHVRAQVGRLLDVIREGAIQNLRRCEYCKKNWFFTRFSSQHFCTPSCQKKAFSRTEKSRLNRRNYMRDYRAGIV